MKKALFFLIPGFFIVLIAGIFALNRFLLFDRVMLSADESDILKNSRQTPLKNNKINENAGDSKITIYAVGDIMMDRGVEYMISKYGNDDFNFPFLKIADYTGKADILFGNLESQISDKGSKIGTVNSFRADIRAIDALKYAGFDVVSVANNHVLDYDKQAMEDSFTRLKNAGIVYAGGGFNEEEAFSPRIIEIKGTKIGFLAYCFVGSEWWTAKGKSSGIAFITPGDLEKIKKDIKKAKQQVDILIVSSHAGDEYQTEQNDFQETLYRSFIDSGADIVLGHHPHVSQPLEGYPPGYIKYSLGNFVFDQGFSENTMKGSLLEIKIEDKKVKNVEEKQIKMNQYFQPELADK